MSRKTKKRRPSLGDENGVMDDEMLAAHRELQALRASGIAGAHRRRGKRRNIKPTNKNAEELAAWVETRHDKLADLR